jgi:hypothetical protein
MSRIKFLGYLFFFCVITYWGHDVHTVIAPAEAETAQAPTDTPEKTPEKPLEKTPENPSGTPETAPPNDSQVASNVVQMAETLANESRYADAITLLQTIPQGAGQFDRAQQLQESWGTAMVTLAKAKLEQGETAECMAILKAVPPVTEAHADAIALSSSIAEQGPVERGIPEQGI